jgi:alpha-1,3-rhamnosyl/mannosyltransferase
MAARSIAIDTRWVESRVAGAGTKTYIDSLTTALLAADTENHYHFWGASVPATAPNAHQHRFAGHYRRAWQLAWKTIGWPPVEWIAPKADLWHFTNYVAPPTNKPFVLTVYDLSFVRHPDFAEPKNLAYLQRFVPDSLERARRIITISDFVRDEILEAFKVPADKVTVTPLAAPPEFSRKVPPAELSNVTDKYGIDGEYFLAVGTLEPRKNLKTLLLAFAAARRQTTEQLVVVGGQGWLFEETQDLLRKLGLGSRVIFTDYVPARELPALYAGAKLFVFPSFYEGFGIPILEAMAAGTPVICSNTSSLPEVGGTAALYFDPNDTEALKLALRRTLADDQLRARLAEAGREQAAGFTWQRTAELTLAAYRQALNA